MFKCTVCGKTVENERVSYCKDCGNIFCIDCVQKVVICPNCNGDIKNF